MKRNQLLATLVAVGMLGLVPSAAALPAEERRVEAPRDFEAFQEGLLAELRVEWETESSLSSDEAIDLLARLRTGEALSDVEGLELARYLRDVDGTPAAAQLIHGWMLRTLNDGMANIQGGPDSDAPWQEDVWDDYGVVLTVAYLAAGTVLPEMLPHNLRILGIYLDLGVDAGCSGGFTSGVCFLRITLDLMGLASLDMHQTTDVAVAQFPLSIEFHLHWSCNWGCSLSFHIHLPETVVASNAEYVFAYPAVAGEVATRATDHEIVMMLYDSLGDVQFQKAHEFTADTPLAQVPQVPSPSGGSPGVGDLHAVAPIPNYYGLQVPPEAPAKPALPGTPSLPGPAQNAVNQARTLYDQVHIRERNDFGTSTADPTGPTVAYQMSQIRAWNLNLAFVRWKNVGIGTQTGLPEPPASFYFDAGGYFTGGGPNQWTVDFSIKDKLV